MDSFTNADNMQQMISLLQNLMSSDNNLRIRSELDFKHLLEASPDAFFYSLIQIALNDSLDLPIRQGSLLHLKRIVPMYWSPAFEKYIGSSTINQDIKKTIRESLLTLIGDPDSKIRNSSSYAIVQIAAVDYPDEWPDLLNYLYNLISNSNSSVFQIIGSLCVIEDIFDDIVTDEQLFENGVAVQVLNTCEILLKENNYNLEIKVEALHLLRIICDSLINVDTDIPGREQFAQFVIPQIYELLLNLSKIISENDQYVRQITAWDYKHQIFLILNMLINSHSGLLENFVLDSVELTLLDLTIEKQIYNQFVTIEPDLNTLKSVFVDLNQFYSSQRERKEPFQVLTMSIAKKIEFLQSLVTIKPINDANKISNICDLLLPFSVLSISNIDDYNLDFNQFVTEETGLDNHITVRESIRDFSNDMNAKDNSIFINVLIQKFNSLMSSNLKHLEVEALFFMLGSCFDNDDTIVNLKTSEINEFLSAVIDMATNEALINEEFQFLTARLILTIPKFMFKYQSSCQLSGVAVFEKILSTIPKLGNAEDFLIIKSSILISLQYYNYFIRAKEFGIQVQQTLLHLVDQLKENSEEDTNMLLLDVMTIIISIDNKALSQNINSTQLLLTIGFKSESNFAINTSLFECIQDSINDIPKENYWNMISSIFPFLNNKISEFNGEYNSQIDLSLQIITVFLKDQSEHGIPPDTFQSTFSTVTKFIFACDDEQLLQSSSECLIELVKNSPSLCSSYVDSETQESGTHILLKSVSKFLSPAMSDRAIVNLGDLVTLLLEQFNNSVGEYLEDILKALSIRLVNAKEVPTIENMILIFNVLTITQPMATVNFLKSFTIGDQPAIFKILPIWFQAYEVMRGYNSILSNVRAFIELYKLNDDIIQTMVVDGDPLQPQVAEGIIITRSMAKKMPIKYEKIPANAKIIRLLLDELKNEVTTGYNLENTLHVSKTDAVYEEEDDDDGWEDLDDEPSFDQLKSYVDDDGNTKRASDGCSDDMKQLLISFFKECTSNNVSNFEYVYNYYLSEAQKSLLTQYLV